MATVPVLTTLPSSVPSPTGTPATAQLPDAISYVGGQILEIMLTIGGIVAVLYLVYAGYRYISAGGDPERSKTARAGIGGAVVGVIIISLAFTIVHFAVQTAVLIPTVAGGTGSK